MITLIVSGKPRPVVYNPVLTPIQVWRWSVRQGFRHQHGAGNTQQSCTQCK